MPSNSAAWLVGEKVRPLEVKEAPYNLPGDSEILVKNAAIALNPVDCAAQDLAVLPLTYPTIIGTDLAGEVVEGTAFSAGAWGLSPGKAAVSGFQQFTVVPSVLASVIPDSLSFERAAVLPLCTATAAAGLYQDDHLSLQYPSRDPQPNGKTVFVWGGSSSVGSNAIQLCVASGYRVITTASSKNFDYVKELGADQVFDYNKPGVIDEIATALDDQDTAGIFDAASFNGAIEACLQLAAKAKSTKFVSTVRHPPKETPTGVTAKMAFANHIMDNAVGKAIFEDFLPQALASGKYVAAPDPYVVGKGLEHVQAGLDYLKAGVSAQKVVITL